MGLPRSPPPKTLEQRHKPHQSSDSKLEPLSGGREARAVTRIVRIHEASEGIGSKVRRCVGNRTVRCLPPFVICEQFRMNELGRPPHPARGAQKITYVMTGKVRLEYSPANTIDLGPGDVTSLMVGKGVIRSVKAIPEESEGAPKASASGIQIFMDVPETFKRIDPSHLNLCHSEILACEPSKGASIKILTGSAFGEKAEQMLTATPALMLDCNLDPGASVQVPVKADWNAFAYIIEGSAEVQGELARKHAYVEFMRSPPTVDREETPDKEDDGTDAVVKLSVDSNATQGARVLFCAAKPLCQPIYRQGPFVDVSMNWIHQAFNDYSERKNGFEADQWWNSHSPASAASIPPSLTSPTGDISQPNKPLPDMPPSGEPRERCNKCKDWDVSSSPYNPCSEGGSCEDLNPQKASFPNSFPPGSINPASHSTEFNGEDCVEEQQERKISKPPSSDSGKRRYSDSTESDTSDSTECPLPQKKQNL